DDGAALALFGRNPLQARNELVMLRPIDRTVLDRRARRILAEIVAALPVPLRPHRPRHEAAAAVRAHVPQHVLDAVATERAFVGADPGFRRGGRQRAVAVLAGGPELQHGQRRRPGDFRTSGLTTLAGLPAA